MIFTNGDSFTYGDELDKPYSEAWPYILSQMLNLDVVNFGENGKDNAGIVQSTKEYHSRVARLPKIWIIQWSTFRRFNDNPPIDVILKKLDKQYLLDLYFIHIPSFGLMVALAFLICNFLIKKEFKKNDLDLKIADDIIFYAILSAIIGSKVYYIIETGNYSSFFNNVSL